MELNDDADLNINNYTITDLLQIYGIEDIDISSNLIEAKTREFVTKFEKEGDDNLVTFFNSANKKLLNYAYLVSDIDLDREIDDVSLNIEEYSNDELLLIYGLEYVSFDSKDDIIQQTTDFKNKFKDDPNMIDFFNKAEIKLLNHIDSEITNNSIVMAIDKDPYNSNDINTSIPINFEKNVDDKHHTQGKVSSYSNITNRTNSLLVLNTQFLTENTSNTTDGIRVKSPIIGTAYLAPEPGAKKFVSIGDKVKKGQTIMIVEAMKTMNHVPSTNDGEVKKILVEDGQPVEFGQTLVLLK